MNKYSVDYTVYYKNPAGGDDILISNKGSLIRADNVYDAKSKIAESVFAHRNKYEADKVIRKITVDAIIDRSTP